MGAGARWVVGGYGNELSLVDLLVMFLILHHMWSQINVINSSGRVLERARMADFTFQRFLSTGRMPALCVGRRLWVSQGKYIVSINTHNLCP